MLILSAQSRMHCSHIPLLPHPSRTVLNRTLANFYLCKGGGAGKTVDSHFLNKEAVSGNLSRRVTGRLLLASQPRHRTTAIMLIS
jgi:hypothetical protein